VETCGAWNECIRAGGDPDPSPLIGTALTVSDRWLRIACQDCRMVGAVDLATLIMVALSMVQLRAGGALMLDLICEGAAFLGHSIVS
jgi:hypothetical protein